MGTLERTIRIGTRDSKLAQWQAELAKIELSKLGLKGELVFIKSKGDLNREKAVSQIGTPGVFTKALDDALLNDEIDIAVHSYKDVPTLIHESLSIVAVLKRGNAFDALVVSEGFDFLDNKNYVATVATGSIRRKAQWLNRFPNHNIVGIRGNVDRRLRELKEGQWNGTILALAGLERLGLKDIKHKVLDWMIPAPAQGAIAIMMRENELGLAKVFQKLNHEKTAMATEIERDFLKSVEGGCSAPVGAYATLQNNNVHLRSVVLSLDGKKKIEVELTETAGKAKGLGKIAAEKALTKGAEQLINS